MAVKTSVKKPAYLPENWDGFFCGQHKNCVRFYSNEFAFGTVEAGMAY